MANVTTAFGLRPVRHLNGSPWNGQTIRCYLHASYAQAMYIGDPVQWQSNLNYMDTTMKAPAIKLSSGATANMINGVITSFDPDPDNLTLQYNPASNERYANVCLAGDVVFQVRDDGLALATKVFVNQNATLSAGTASTITGLSGYVLDTTTPTTTQAHPLHILCLSDIPDNELATSAIFDVVVSTSKNITGEWLGITAS